MHGVTLSRVRHELLHNRGREIKFLKRNQGNFVAEICVRQERFTIAYNHILEWDPCMMLETDVSLLGLGGYLPTLST